MSLTPCWLAFVDVSAPLLRYSWGSWTPPAALITPAGQPVTCWCLLVCTARRGMSAEAGSAVDVDLCLFSVSCLALWTAAIAWRMKHVRLLSFRDVTAAAAVAAGSADAAALQSGADLRSMVFHITLAEVPSWCDASPANVAGRVALKARAVLDPSVS